MRFRVERVGYSESCDSNQARCCIPLEEVGCNLDWRCAALLSGDSTHSCASRSGNSGDLRPALLEFRNLLGTPTPTTHSKHMNLNLAKYCQTCFKRERKSTLIRPSSSMLFKLCVCVWGGLGFEKHSSGIVRLAIPNSVC